MAMRFTSFAVVVCVRERERLDRKESFLFLELCNVLCIGVVFPAGLLPRQLSEPFNGCCMVEGGLPDSRRGWSIGVGSATGDLEIISLVSDDGVAEAEWEQSLGWLHRGKGLQGEQGAYRAWGAFSVMRGAVGVV
jgi:hypothetical protein